jgi:hypothetical protein
MVSGVRAAKLEDSPGPDGGGESGSAAPPEAANPGTPGTPDPLDKLAPPGQFAPPRSLGSA